MNPDQTAQPDTEQVHSLATEAEKCLGQLATGLGQIGADPQAVDAITKMADVIRQIASGLAKGMKQQPAAPAHTMDTATTAMMADHAAARGQ